MDVDEFMATVPSSESDLEEEEEEPEMLSNKACKAKRWSGCAVTSTSLWEFVGVGLINQFVFCWPVYWIAAKQTTACLNQRQQLKFRVS